MQFAGNLLSVFFTEDEVRDYAGAQAAATWRFPAFFHALLERGVYAPPSAFEAWFVSAALDDDCFGVARVGAPVRGAGRGHRHLAGRGRAVSRSTVMTRTVVHLLRHGEVHNPDKILYGRLPGFRLSETGSTRPRSWPKAFTDIDLVAVLASPMQRAQETAAPAGRRARPAGA